MQVKSENVEKAKKAIAEIKAGTEKGQRIEELIIKLVACDLEAKNG